METFPENAGRRQLLPQQQTAEWPQAGNEGEA
jgi:hypothetical protein